MTKENLPASKTAWTSAGASLMRFADKFRLSRENASKLLAAFALVLSLVALVVLLALRYHSTVFFAASLVVGSIVYLVLSRKRPTVSAGTFATSPATRRRLTRLSMTLFFFLMGAACLIVGATPYQKPLSYYAVTASASAFLVLQIVLIENRRNVPVILGQVLVFAGVLLGSSQVTFPLGVGGYDAPSHVELLVVPILQTGRIPGTVPCQFDFDYEAFPSQHMLAASGSILLGLDPARTYFGLAVVGMLLTCCVVFLVARSLFGARVGLFAALIVSASSYFIYWASHASALSFGIPLISLLMLAIVKWRSRPTRQMVLVAAILATALVFTHPYSSMIFAAVLVSLVAGNGIGWRRTARRPRPALWTAVIFLGVLALHWTFYSCQTAIALRLARAYVNIIGGERLISGPAVYDALPAQTILLNTFGDSLLLVLAVVGFYIVLSRDRRFARLIVLGPTVTLFVLAAIGLITRLPYLLPNRVYVLLQFLGLAPLAAVAIGRIVFGSSAPTSKAPPMTTNLRRTVGAALLVASFCFASSASTVAGFETSPFVGETPYVKPYETQHERDATSWLCTNLGFGHRVEASLSLSPFDGRKLERCVVEQNGRFDDIQISADGSINFTRFVPGTIILFSDFDRDPGVLFTTTGVGKHGTGVIVRVNEGSISHLLGLDKVYDNGPLQIFFQPG